MLAYESRGVGSSEPIEDADLDRASFYEILRAWRSHRSLASIMPRVRPHASGSKQDDGVILLVSDVVEKNPDAARRQLAEIASKRLKRPPSLSTIEAVVDKVRVQRERDGLGGEDGFGLLLLVDTCPASLRLVGWEQPLIAWTGFVVDVATGTVVASGAANGPFAASAIACLRAADRIGELSSGGEEKPKIEVHLRGDAVSLMKETARLDSLGIDVRPASGRRSEASRISAILSRRFGPTVLRLRMEVPAEAADSIGSDGLSAAGIIDARIDGEAERRWKAWRETGKVPAVNPAEVQATLREIVPLDYRHPVSES